MAAMRSCGSGTKMAPWVLVMAAASVWCFAVIANMRAGTNALERRAVLCDRQVVQSEQVIRSLEREMSTLTAPSAIYAHAATALGMQRVQLAGVIRVNGPVDASVMSASLPGASALLRP